MIQLISGEFIMKLLKIITLKDEALLELYTWYDKEVRPLPKNKDGSFDHFAHGLDGNDIDAMRHSYISGVYVMEFNDITSDILGRLNELINLNYSNIDKKSENMDLWNNAVGRRYARSAKTHRELYEKLLKAMNAGELIVDISDKRKYKGEKMIKRAPKSFVIKIKESKTGSNIEFYDVRKKLMLNKEEFIKLIREGKYPGYSIRKHFDGEYPFSTRDKFKFNNLG